MFLTKKNKVILRTAHLKVICRTQVLQHHCKKSLIIKSVAYTVSAPGECIIHVRCWTRWPSADHSGLLLQSPWRRFRIHTVSKKLPTAICDPRCENPAKVFFCVICCFLHNIIIHMVKNILWIVPLYLWYWLSRVMSKFEIIVKLMEEIKLWCSLSHN